MGNEQDIIRQPNVLIIDGPSANIQILKIMLKQRGYNVRSVFSGELALQFVRENPPDLILLEIFLPDIEGYKVCEILKTDEKLKEIPIVFMGTHIGNIEKNKIFAVGGNDYINIPFNDKEVLSRIETQLKLCSLQRINKKLTEEIVILKKGSKEESTTEIDN